MLQMKLKVIEGNAGNAGEIFLERSKLLKIKSTDFMTI